MKTNFVHKPESNTLDFSLAPLKTHIMRFLNTGLLVRNATSLHSAGLDRDLGILAGYAARRSKARGLVTHNGWVKFKSPHTP